ncbi:segregation and condensation protein A [Nanchangia anserum]|uniref:segregation and condensation protein A n=1 Tax=Nanchangia anserum TaxID=2692125 RepID=UPI001D0FA634|nr:ScpA family protein [Nanchangia anserum]
MASPREATGRLDQFSLELDNFTGPLDLLLSLITRRRLDITEVALSEVTDEFLAHMRRYPDLSQTSEFVVIAATLLDIKATRLLPGSEDDPDDIDYLEARDLLFARLLQYRAYKEAAQQLRRLADAESHYVARGVELEERFRSLVPEVEVRATPEQLARIAALALSQSRPSVALTHLHDPVVPVRSQIRAILEALGRRDSQTFDELIADADRPAVIVSRFLALLELYRARLVSLSQDGALATLGVTYTPEGDGVSGPDWAIMSERGDDE